MLEQSLPAYKSIAIFYILFIHRNTVKAVKDQLVSLSYFICGFFHFFFVVYGLILGLVSL